MIRVAQSRLQQLCSKSCYIQMRLALIRSQSNHVKLVCSSVSIIFAFA